MPSKGWIPRIPTRPNSREQKKKYVSPIARGEKICCFVLTEPGAGSDLAGIKTTAIRDGDAYVIDGTKRFITHGSIAGLITVFAVTDPGDEVVLQSPFYFNHDMAIVMAGCRTVAVPNHVLPDSSVHPPV